MRNTQRPHMRTHPRNERAGSSRFVYAAVLMYTLACGGGGDKGGVITPPPPPPPPPNTAASLSGIITDESDGARVAGAVVTVGALIVTTQADGAFSFTALSQGAVSIRVSAPGFDPLERATQLVAGSNSRTLMLTRLNTVFESGVFTTYVPPGISTFRGAFVFLYGGNIDARPMIRGDVDFYPAFAVPQVTEHRRRLMAFGRAHGFAIIGTETPPTPTSLADNIRSALQNVAQRSGHAELANAPLLVMGHSRGGCMAYQIAVQAPDQVIGVLPLAGAGVAGCYDGSPGLSVPVYIIFGELELAIKAESTPVFDFHRSRGGLWALGIEAGAGHAWPVNNDVLFNWAAAVATRRLPETVVPGAPVQLRSISESSGWLADRTSFVIAPFGCFTGDRPRASWVPGEQNARDWQAVMAPGTSPTITTCAQ